MASSFPPALFKGGNTETVLANGDVVIGHAVRVGWQQSHPSLRPENYPQHKAQAWGQFYRSSPGDCRRWQVTALRELAEEQGLV